MESTQPKETASTDKNLLVLDEEVGIDNIKTLHKALMEISSGERAVSIDASRVKLIDTAAMQLLASITRAQESAGKEIRWQETSAAFLETARVLGLDSPLGL